MGNRVKGRVKKKSIKAAMHSGMGSKRKLSRMGKKRKKDHAGLDATFIGRSACLKKLQVSLKDFRRLCILKGVYPREPRGRAPGKKKGQVYYHIKDVKAIAHEPLLEKFREFKTFMKRIRKAAGRNEKDEAARLDAQNPVYTLHHLVRERYPRFIDAISDLDDALILIHLFAALPSAHRIKTKVTTKAKELATAWSAYCAITSSITKSFVSVKGVYFEAHVHTGGVTSQPTSSTQVRWIVPHAFTQHLPNDVDYRVMLTFFEFYEVLLGFVLYKLYHDIGVRYPFAIPQKEERSVTSPMTAYLLALKRVFQEGQAGALSSTVSAAASAAAIEESSKHFDSTSKQSQPTSKDLTKKVDEALQKISKEEDDSEMESNDEDDNDNDNDGHTDGPLGESLKSALQQLAEENYSHKTNESATSIPNSLLSDDATKRKRLFSKLTFFLSREVPRGYLELICLSYGGQIGWEGDDSPINVKDSSITHHIVDRPKLPSSFHTLPKSREYIQPQWILDCANNEFLLPCSRYSIGCELPPHLSPWVNNEEEGYKPAYAEEIEKLMQGEMLSDHEENDFEDDTNKTPSNEMDLEQDEDKDTNIESSHVETEEDADEEETPVSSTKKRKKEEEEAHNLAKLMMSKKAARLYGRMQHGISQKQEKVKHLQRRRDEIELEKLDNLQRQNVEIDISVKGKSADGKTVQKQKVDRLKHQRKSIENKYKDKGSKSKK